MRSELDRKFDEELARVTGPGGRLAIGRDEHGRAIVTNFPATVPDLFRTFCSLNAEVEAVVAGEERLTFAELDRISECVAHGLAARGIGKGDRVGIAMRNCPSWIVAYMAILKAGAVATLLNGWWEAHEMQHALDLTNPKLLIADAPRAKRIAARCPDRAILTLPIDEEVEQAMAELLHDRDENSVLPDVAPEDDATILFTSGSTGEAKGALSTHRAVTTGVYAYASGLIVLLGILTEEGRPPTAQARTLLSVPLFHVTGELPVMLNSFVIGRCMVLMPKWDAAEALRLIERERITYFVGVPTMSLEIMTHPERSKYDLSSLTDITAGGAPRPISHVERLQREFPNAQPALGYGLTETNAVGCANFWGNYAAKPASTGRAQAPLVEVAILGPVTAICRLERSARSVSAARRISNTTGKRPKRPRRSSPTIFTSAPATSAISTRTAICSSSTARRRSSSAAARTSRRPRSRRPVTHAPTLPKCRCSECPTSASARCRSRSFIWLTAPGSASRICRISSKVSSPNSRSPSE